MRYLSFILFLSLKGNAQVGIGTNEPHPSAVLEIQSEHKGLLIPRVALKSTNDTLTIPGISNKTDQRSAPDTLKNTINKHSKKKNNKKQKNGK